MARISIRDLMEATGLSRATIDRSLNGRGKVHPRTQKVIDAAIARLEADGSASFLREVPLDIVLRTGRGLLMQVAGTLEALGRPSIAFHDMYQRNEAEMLERVRALCADPTRPLIITAKNTAAIRAELSAARAKGKRIVTFVSDLTHDARNTFISIDNRMAGETAAFILGSLFAGRPAKVGVVLGDYAFTCHEEREIGFRSHLRTHFSEIAIVHEAQGEDAYEGTREAAAEMLAAHPDLDAIYNVAGGNAGLAEALRAAGGAGRIRVLSHEANHITAPLVRERVIDYVLAQDTAAMLQEALRLATAPSLAGEPQVHHVDFGIYTRLNLPASVSTSAALHAQAAPGTAAP